MLKATLQWSDKSRRQQLPRLLTTYRVAQWGTTAPLWRSSDGGQMWTKDFTINPPPGDSGAIGCPCDQSVDFNPVNGTLAGTFLTDNIFGAASNNLTVSPGAFNYFQSPPTTAVPTTHLVPGVDADQPWLLAYDNFSGAPDMRIAVAAGSSPLNFTTDNISGFSTGGVNPGHRLAIDPRSGAVYSLFQRNIGPGAGGSKNINYMLNRSTDGGKTWTLNGSGTGIVVANADSTQPQPKFCTVNALLGGVDHAAVDPKSGAVVYVYGTRDALTGNKSANATAAYPKRYRRAYNRAGKIHHGAGSGRHSFRGDHSEPHYWCLLLHL